MLRWMFQRLLRGRLGFSATGTAPALASADVRHPAAGTGDCHVTWIGHSSFLIQVDGLNILTDPVWGDRASPVSWAGPRRLVPPGLSLDALPRIDLVLQSHDHYDHFCDATVRALAARHPNAHWLAPLGVAAQLRARGVTQVSEHDWHQSVTACGATATAVPAAHFSGRTMASRNQTLWCGWVLKTARHHIYFVGDTGHHPEFDSIGQQHGPFDVVLVPIGAYDPRWFMRPVHVDPEEAVQLFDTVAGRDNSVMIAMHWGTFVLTDEPVDEPPRRTRAAWDAKGRDPSDLWIMRPGETRTVQARA